MFVSVSPFKTLSIALACFQTRSFRSMQRFPNELPVSLLVSQNRNEKRILTEALLLVNVGNMLEGPMVQLRIRQIPLFPTGNGEIIVLWDMYTFCPRKKNKYFVHATEILCFPNTPQIFAWEASKFASAFALGEIWGNLAMCGGNHKITSSFSEWEISSANSCARDVGVSFQETAEDHDPNLLQHSTGGCIVPLIMPEITSH